jgi:6-hydroxytryprostatin B O-methyltransferase
MCEQLNLQRTAADIVANTVVVSEYYHHQSDVSGPSAQPQVARARANLLEAALKIQQLVMDPSEFLSHTLMQQQQFACIRWICHFRIPFYIPSAPASRSYSEVAKLASVPEKLLQSVARMTMTAGFLCETKTGKVAHTPLSASFSDKPDLYNWMMYMANRTVPTMAKFVEATERWGDTTKKNETAYSLAMGTELSFFEHINSRPELNEEFGAYMKSQASSKSGTNVEFLLQGFDWGSLGGGVVVDVGGGGGDASIGLAKKYPKPFFFVQDLVDTIQNAQKRATDLSADISQRIQFQAHDFFTPQPVKDADVYLLRMILHDWPHAESVRILQHLVDALKPGARIIIMDMVLPTPGSVDRTLEAMLRQKDLTMRQGLNACERELEDWHTLFQAVDPPLHIQNVERPEGSQHSVLTLSLDRVDSHLKGTKE